MDSKIEAPEAMKFNRLTQKEVGLFFAIGGALAAVAMGFYTIAALIIGAGI